MTRLTLRFVEDPTTGLPRLDGQGERLPEADLATAEPVLTVITEHVDAQGYTCDTDIGKISLVGAGMRSNPGVAMNFHEGATGLILLSFFRGALLRARNADATFLRNQSHRFGEGTLFHFHNETKNIAALAATKAMKNLFHRMDCEGGRFLRMERA